MKAQLTRADQMLKCTVSISKKNPDGLIGLSFMIFIRPAAVSQPLRNRISTLEHQ